jgi:hypothetical protein
LSADWRWALALSGIIGAPALVTPQYIVHNAVAIYFPAWVPTGMQQPRGVDAMGQRLIMMAGVVCSLLLFAVPGAIAGGIVWVATRGLLGAAALVPVLLAALAAVPALVTMGATLQVLAQPSLRDLPLSAWRVPLLRTSKLFAQGGQYVIDEDDFVSGLLFEFWRELREDFLRRTTAHNPDLARRYRHTSHHKRGECDQSRKCPHRGSTLQSLKLSSVPG